MKFLSIKVPKGNEYSYEQSLAIFSSLIGDFKKSLFSSLFGKAPKKSYSFNIISVNQKINFIVAIDDNDLPHITNQILAQYPNAEITLHPGFKFETQYVYELELSKSSVYPIKTVTQFEGIDPLASVISSISRSTDPKAVFWFQIIIVPTSDSWQNSALSHIDALNKTDLPLTQQQKSNIAQMQEKVKFQGFTAYLRILSNNKANLESFLSAYTIFSQSGGNHLVAKEPGSLSRTKLMKAINDHRPYGRSSILNTLEIATLWHLPTAQINIPNIEWGKKLNLETPENLPISEEDLDEAAKQNISFLGKAKYKNRETVYGIKREDRMKHVYIVGKTGTGKSTLIENMAIEDIRKGEGVAILDPHGDDINILLDYIPKNRIKDVCYFNPSDPEYCYPLNLLEIHNVHQKELMVSGIIAIFYKLYSHSWGPRLEYILRNVLFTLVEVPDADLSHVLNILLDKKYRDRALKHVTDPILLQFWQKEFEGMDAKQMQEAVAPILNKVGQFVTSPLVRRIV